ncbi:putative membrane protein [Microbacterium sp. 1154]|uniref:hypothetical protein n=1 Tax=Microbacterium sp. 1154 TaxID=2817733 RepID=UPI000E37EA6B|nr:hypothetical protein [Microbacterium sp. 1154]MDR6689348.1 putative membrane protein [Microbacterium sp. 1154]
MKTAIARSALWRGIIAAVLVAITLVMLLVALDVWVGSIGAAFLALPGNLLVTVLFAVVAARSFVLARRGAQTERGASIDRALVLVSLIVGGFMLVLPACTVLGDPGGIAVAIYAVVITAILVVLCRSNWRTPSSSAPLASHGPLI